jgi:prevent-host-death family protein
MPEIRPSADLRNNYNEISEFCHKHEEPVYITKNGRGDLAVMSIDTYQKLAGRFELQRLLQEGLDASSKGKARPAEDVFADLERKLDV